MTLKEALKDNKGQTIKVGARWDEEITEKHKDEKKANMASGFVYCGACDAEARKALKAYLDRKVIDIYPSCYGGNIIIFAGEEKGDFWTVEEYAGKKPEPMNVEELREDCCNELVNAVYSDSAEDYIWGLVSGNKGLCQKEEKFLTSGMYGIAPNFGESIIEKAQRETALAKMFVEEFDKSGLKKHPIPTDKVVLTIVKMIVKERKKFSLQTKGGVTYIKRKEVKADDES